MNFAAATLTHEFLDGGGIVGDLQGLVRGMEEVVEVRLAHVDPGMSGGCVLTDLGLHAGHHAIPHHLFRSENLCGPIELANGS